jgi:hypothetical protein
LASRCRCIDLLHLTYRVDTETEMLANAIREIRQSLLQADHRRRQGRRPPALTQAEGYAGQLEELMLEGVASVPAELRGEIHDFVEACSAALARRLERRERSPAVLLDALFDLEELLQQQSAAVSRRRTAQIRGGATCPPRSTRAA